jgi:D-serine deaminase-like pyridoxal phosphate-dependent protein
MDLADLPTPALLLDPVRMRANIARMNAAIAARGVQLRPHLKTVKSAEIAREMTAGWSGAVTVSTLKEAEQFAAAGYRDILYAVGIAPGKLDQAARIVMGGVTLTLILDSVEAARAAASQGVDFPVLIEVDSDGQRAGVGPNDAERLLAIGSALGSRLNGVMTHRGGSYGAGGPGGLPDHAEAERLAVVRAAETLRAAGHACPVVSVGSTPTALFARDLTGVTEVRAGVYVFQDLVMAGLGVCGTDDIAVSVLATVIGHQTERGWIVTDAGWMALSRDAGRCDQGYGLVAGDDELIVASANQEHGIVADRHGGPVDFSRFPIGSRLRILPNHACATAAQHDSYHLLDGSGGVAEVWPRFGGW